MNFSVCCDFSSVLRLVCLYLLCIFEVHSSTFILDLSGNAVALPSTAVLISLHFYMRFSSNNCFCVLSKLSFLQEICIFVRKTFGFSQKVCIPLRNTYLLLLSTNFLLISLSLSLQIECTYELLDLSSGGSLFVYR